MLPKHQNEQWDSGRYRANHTKYLANSGFRIVDPLGRSIPFRKIFTSGMPGPPDMGSIVTAIEAQASCIYKLVAEIRTKESGGKTALGD